MAHAVSAAGYLFDAFAPFIIGAGPQSWLVRLVLYLLGKVGVDAKAAFLLAVDWAIEAFYHQKFSQMGQ